MLAVGVVVEIFNKGVKIQAGLRSNVLGCIVIEGNIKIAVIIGDGELAVGKHPG